MTTPAHSELAYSLTKHYFGQPVATVIRALFNYDQASLQLLRHTLPEIKLRELKKSLLILVKYQLVDYVKTVKNFSQQYEYSVVPQRIFAFFRVSRFIQTTYSNEGNTSGIILTKLAEKAMLSKEYLTELSMETIMKNQIQSENLPTSSQIDDLIDAMISKSYIVRTSNNLCMNIERFSRTYRDDLVTETIFSYYYCDKRIKSLCRTILELTLDNTDEGAAITAPIPLTDLHNALIPSAFEDKNQLEKYLVKLTTEDNNRFFVASGMHPNKGPMYGLGVGLVIDYLVKEHLSSLITTRFGPKCCRVFRVLLSRGALLLKQVEESIMLPARDVREYSYMLMKEGFIRNRQVPKTPDNAPGKSVFIMSVELDQVVYNATDLCCRSINNLLLRHEHQIKKNSSLLERSKAVQDLLDSSGEQDSATIQEYWNQYFNSHELSQLESINRNLNRMMLAKSQVDETLFLLHSWLSIRPNLEVLNSA